MSKLAGIFGFVGAGTTLNVGHRWKETRSCASVSMMEEWHGVDSTRISASRRCTNRRFNERPS